ncbi:MAG TPA: ABC transporter substrate-binding protein [Acidimicrobiales bacterium]
MRSPMRFNRLLATLFALVLLAAACGSDDDGGDGDTTTTGGDGAAVDLTGQSVEVAAIWSGDEQERFEAVLDGFEEATGATVAYSSTGDDIAAVLGTSIAGGSPPDVAILPQPGLLSDLAGQGALVEIQDAAGALVDSNYAPVWRDLGSVDGTLYGVWFKAANKSTVWYNVGAFGDAGVEPPETWDDFLAVLQALSDAGIPPLSVAGADGWTLTDWFENVYLRTAGADSYDALVAHEIPWTDDTVVTALETLAEAFTADFLADGSSAALQTDFPTSVTNTYSDPPGAGVVYEGDFVAGVISDETTAVLGTDADFFPFPSIDGSPSSVVGGGDVAVLLADTEAGNELIKYLASAEAAEIWAGLGGFTSPNQGVDSSIYPDAITARSAEALTAAEVFRFDLSDLQPSAFGGTVGSGLFKQFQDFLGDTTSIAAVTGDMEASAAAAF